MNWFRFILLCLAVPASHQVYGYSLSSVATFHRCYSQFTQTRVPRDLPLLKSVEAGMDPIEACMKVLDSALLSAADGTTLGTSTDVTARLVLKTFHNLHASWFYNKNFPDFGQPTTLGNALGDMYDTSTPAMYFTRALFRPSTAYSSVVTLNSSLITIRTNGEPVNPVVTGMGKGGWRLPVDFAPSGALIGIKQTTPRTLPLASINYDKGQSYGGGVLGDPVHMLQNSMGTLQPQLDGAIGTWRRWSKAVFKDLLCRELPVVRDEDARPFVAPNSPVPFRNAVGCNVCHASMDRMAGVVRGMTFIAPPESSTQMRGVFVKVLMATEPAEGSWTESPDPKYMNRPARGTFYFRNYSGELIDRPIDSIAHLGNIIAEQDDYYICAARRYYRYLLGVDAQTEDPKDPKKVLSNVGGLASHRNQVIELGKNLRTDQSLRNLIRRIISLPEYRKSEFTEGSN